MVTNKGDQQEHEPRYGRKYLTPRTLWFLQKVQTKFQIGTNSGTGLSGKQRRPPNLCGNTEEKHQNIR